MERSFIKGFSSLNRNEKIRLVADSGNSENLLDRHRHPDEAVQQVYEQLAENCLSNYHLPYCVAPNFVVNGRIFHVPMVTEESSVVAAASAAAKFWSDHGGFNTRVLSETRSGHIHFLWQASPEILSESLGEITGQLLTSVEDLTAGMRARGGGIEAIRLVSLCHRIPGYYTIEVDFHTADAMGANFINSCLERMSGCLQAYLDERNLSENLEIIMSILSNHIPSSIVECQVVCRDSDLDAFGLPTGDFSRRFSLAVQMACQNVSRAVTHNKGIMNGVDAVLIATGNDFRAVEAGVHAFASSAGEYTSLSIAGVENGVFSFTLRIPLAIGTVGGITRVHPLADHSLAMLGNPDARTLMSIVSAVGLASNFSAVKALITTGIQKGHMRLHLMNLLKQLHANEREQAAAISHFSGQTVSYSAVARFIDMWRNNSLPA